MSYPLPKRRLQAACALCLQGLAPAWASDADARALAALLGTEVQGVSRQAEKSLDAPASVSLFGAAEARALGHRTLGDMLQRLPGISIGTSRLYSSVGVRGFARPGDFNARVLMAIDGFRVNDGIYDQALPEYEFPIVADWIKRVELVGGPAASVYGGNAVLGVANVVTLDGADAPGLTLSAGTGSHRTLRLGGQYGWHGDGADAFVGVSAGRQRGETLTAPELVGPATPDGRVAGLDGQHHHNLLAKLRWGSWRLTGVGQRRGKDAALAPWGTLPGVPGTRIVDAYHYAEAVHDGDWRGDWRPTLRLSAARTRYDGHYAYDDGAGGALVNRDIAAATTLGADARANWRGWINHQVVAGLEWRQVRRGDQVNFDEAPAGDHLRRRDRVGQVGLYLQDQWRLSERWLLTTGLRADRVAGFGGEWSPRVALVHRPGPNEAVKLMLGRAFRAPNLNERFYDDGVSQMANPALQPERAHTVELSWERAVGRQGRLAASLYHFRLSRPIEEVAQDAQPSQYQNVAGARSTGLEIDLEQRPVTGWQWRANLSLNHATRGADRLTNAPAWMAKGHAFGPLATHWHLGLEAQAVGRREGLRGAVPAQAWIHAVLRRSGLPGPGELTLRVTNLGDRALWEPATSENALARVPRERRALALDWRSSFP